MLKTRIINPDLLYELAKLGHTDEVVICDMGLPIPKGIKIVDLSFTQGVLDFETVYDELVENLFIEKYFIAKEWSQQNDLLYEKIAANKVVMLPHSEFKEKVKNAKLVVRTGENKPYRNIILSMNVSF